jgi:hypothetical protein
LSRRRALACFVHRLLKAFAVGSFARQLRDPFNPESAARALYPVELHHHRGRVLKARQIAYFALADFLDSTGRHVLPTSRANQLESCLFPPYPELQLLAGLVDFNPIHPVPRPPQHARPVMLSHPPQAS